MSHTTWDLQYAHSASYYPSLIFLLLHSALVRHSYACISNLLTYLFIFSMREPDSKKKKITPLLIYAAGSLKTYLINYIESFNIIISLSIYYSSDHSSRAFWYILIAINKLCFKFFYQNFQLEPKFSSVCKYFIVNL